ncbi:tetratricopeptide repeat protein [Stakelama saccharophila]|uniref:Tetratricopeptide repeat protein n=1 Tax=Stakelama saccharophila TaxID=3075605 RepID=A0ABZ0B5B1_9SPHN|nr:tetratricopeptide repeat protein [Stakelama sp. W311]WNO52500.1 tetratricopeptide repeat protein [Stakelama sp. W311]
MRITAVSAAVALTLVCVSTSLYGQRPDDQIDPRSIALVKKGDAARAAGELQRATDLYETALAVDPRNREAFVDMAVVAKRQGLTGKAIRLYREALKLDPTDLAALRGQGEAMVAKGAVTSAEENLKKMRKICGATCSQADQLAAVIRRGPPEQATATAQQDVEPKPAGDD